MLRIAGHRRFLLGLYGLPKTDKPEQAARDAGFEVVHVPPDPAALARLRGAQLMGWTELGAISPDSKAKDEARITRIVNSLKNEPNLLFWESVDEPSYIWQKPRSLKVEPGPIIAARNFVRRLDPGRPFFLNHSPTNLVETLSQYNEGAEIIGMDIYPVIPHGMHSMPVLWPATGRQGDLTDATISQVGPYTDKMRRVAGHNRAVIMVLQGFAWENFRPVPKRDPKLIVYPSEAELRFMAWQAIVHGANGLLFFGVDETPAEAPLWVNLTIISRELAGLAAPLAAKGVTLDLKPRYHELGHSIDRGIEWCARPHGDGMLLVAVNADGNPIEVTMTAPPSVRSCDVISEGRQLPVDHGAFRDSFNPWGVHLYKLGPNAV